MARTKKVQVSFNRGALSPLLDGRLDLYQAQSALRTCNNMIVDREGGVRRRPGTRYIGSVKGTSPGGDAPESGDVITVPLVHNYAYSPDANASYSLHFRGEAVLYASGGGRLVGEIGIQDQVAGGLPIVNTSYEVWVGESAASGEFVTIGNLTSTGDSSAVSWTSVDVEYGAPGSGLLFLLFGNRDETIWKVNALAWPDGWQLPFSIPKDPALVTAGDDAAVTITRYGTAGLTITGRHVDDGAAPNSGASLFSSDQDWSTWAVTNFVVEYDVASVGVSFGNDIDISVTIPAGATSGKVIQLVVFNAGTNVRRPDCGRIGPIPRL